MGFLHNNGIPGKDKIYKTILKSSKSNTKGIAVADVAVTKYIRPFGLASVQVHLLNGTPWLFVARLKDIIELHEEGKICIPNIHIKNGNIQLLDCVTNKYFLVKKKDITHLPLNKIPATVVNEVKDVIYNSKAYIYWGL